MIEALVNPDRSTVILGLPSFFAVITNLVHHVVGTPGPIFFSTPLLTSASIIAFTCSLKWRGTGTGLCTTTGTASGSVWILIGGPSVQGISCLLQARKALLA